MEDVAKIHILKRIEGAGANYYISVIILVRGGELFLPRRIKQVAKQNFIK